MMSVLAGPWLTLALFSDVGQLPTCLEDGMLRKFAPWLGINAACW
jgi:hypothetical protein